MLLAGLFDSLAPLHPNRGDEMHTDVFITETAPLRRILTQIGEPAKRPPTPGMEEVEPRLKQRPRINPAHRPPVWDDPPVEAVPDWDGLGQPQPEYVFDQQGSGSRLPSPGPAGDATPPAPAVAVPPPATPRNATAVSQAEVFSSASSPSLPVGPR